MDNPEDGIRVVLTDEAERAAGCADCGPTPPHRQPLVVIVFERTGRRMVQCTAHASWTAGASIAALALQDDLRRSREAHKPSGTAG